MVTRLRQIRAFVSVVLRMLAGDPSAAFFMLFLPILIIVIVGSAFGGQQTLRVGVVVPDAVQGDELAVAFLDAVEDAEGLELETYETFADLQSAVRKFDVDGGIVVQVSFGERLARGETAVGTLALPGGRAGFALDTAVQGAIDEVRSISTAAEVAIATGEVDRSRAEQVARDIDVGTPVAVTDVNVSGDRELPSRFALTAPQNLVLFTFINALTTATALVVIRRDGVLVRALAAPVSPGIVVAGLGLAWFLVAMFQSLVILGVGAVFFGVDWGDPVAGALLILVFALVGSGAGLMVGALGRDVDRVSSVTPVLGIALAALGGCMMPVEIFPPTMEAVAHIVPHYWAITGWETLIFDGGGVGDIMGSVVVLAGFAAVLIGGAALALRRDLVRGGLR